MRHLFITLALIAFAGCDPPAPTRLLHLERPLFDARLPLQRRARGVEQDVRLSSGGIRARVTGDCKAFREILYDSPVRAQRPAAHSFGGLAVAIVLALILPVIGASEAYLATWTEFDCVGPTCTYESRHLLTYPFASSGSVPRSTLASHPAALTLRVIDSNRRTSDVRLLGTSTVSVFQSTQSEAQAKYDDLTRAAGRPPWA